MDRIRKALDLAREERSRVLDPAVEELRPSDARPSAGLPASIEYTTTRTFEPSAALLESNRILSPSDSTSRRPHFEC